MRSTRLLVLTVIGGLLTAALLLDGSDVFDELSLSEAFERHVEHLDVPAAHSVPDSSRGVGTWFCPGGSAPGGRADVSLEIINASTEPVAALVEGVRSGLGVAPADTVVRIGAGGRSRVRLADLVSDSEWMGAVVEVDSADVVVEQTYLGASGTTDRALCHTRTSDLWVAASGATEFATRGEEMLLLLLNPFPHDAVLDIRFYSDVGADTLNGAVVPARRVVALDVNEVVPAAGAVSAVVDVVVGRIAASRIQSRGLAGQAEHSFPVGLAVSPLASTTAPVWHLMNLHSEERFDVVSVVNPSTDHTAEVDLEIVSGEGLSLDPIELTIAAGAMSQVSLSNVERLSGLGSYGVTARSLTGLPIAVMHESSDLFAAVPPDEATDGAVDGAVDRAVDGAVDGAVDDGESLDPGAVSGIGPANVSLAATVGVDVSATRWLAPLDGATHSLVVFNPSPLSIARVEVARLDEQGRTLVTSIELAPLRRVSLRASDLGSERPIVEVVSASPVVVSRDLIGVSQHQLLPGVVAAESLPGSRSSANEPQRSLAVVGPTKARRTAPVWSAMSSSGTASMP